jgi:hypothetical protein
MCWHMSNAIQRRNTPGLVRAVFSTLWDTSFDQALPCTATSTNACTITRNKTKDNDSGNERKQGNCSDQPSGNHLRNASTFASVLARCWRVNLQPDALARLPVDGDGRPDVVVFDRGTVAYHLENCHTVSTLQCSESRQAAPERIPHTCIPHTCIPHTCIPHTCIPRTCTLQ